MLERLSLQKNSDVKSENKKEAAVKLGLCFKDIELGTLSYDLGVYKYVSNKEGEERFRAFLNSRAYKLFDSKNLLSQELFEPFLTFANNIKARKDLSQMCVSKGCDDFDILCAYAQFDQEKSGYHLIVK